MTAANRSFSAFWQWIWPHYRKACFRTLVGVPVASLAAITLRNALVCYAIWDGDSATACIALRDPRSALGEIFAVWWVVLFVIAAMLSQALLLEWLKYLKDEPSAFTHGGWRIEGHPGYTRRLKEVGADTFELAGMSLRAQVLAENHRRFEGDFSEAVLLNQLRRKFARTDNRPVVDSKDHLAWKITQSSGTQVHIDLHRHPQADPPVWTMRTEFYEWAGRKNPPKLARTYVTEFVCRNPSSSRP